MVGTGLNQRRATVPTLPHCVDQPGWKEHSRVPRNRTLPESPLAGSRNVGAPHAEPANADDEMSIGG